MTDIVVMDGNQAVTNTFAIAEGTRVEHKAVIQLTRRYQEDLEDFGRVTFEMRPFETPGGMQHREVALLNEPQSTLLMTYMKNTPIVREFKKRLVKAFYELAGQSHAKALAFDTDARRRALARLLKDSKPAWWTIYRCREANLSIAETARAAKVSRAVVKHAIRDMRELGIISWERNYPMVQGDAA